MEIEELKKIGKVSLGLNMSQVTCGCCFKLVRKLRGKGQCARHYHIYLIRFAKKNAFYYNEFVRFGTNSLPALPDANRAQVLRSLGALHSVAPVKRTRI